MRKILIFFLFFFIIHPLKAKEFNLRNIVDLNEPWGSTFINQEELLSLLEKNNFKKCMYRNLSGGVVSIHSGWKI